MTWLLVAGPLLMAFGTALLAPGLWRAWTKAPAQPPIAPAVVLRSRSRGLATRLRDQGRHTEANLFDTPAPSLTDLLALLREHGVSTSPDPQP